MSYWNFWNLSTKVGGVARRKFGPIPQFGDFRSMKGHIKERKSTFYVSALLGNTFSRLRAKIISKWGGCLVSLFINCHDFKIELTDGGGVLKRGAK